MNHGDAGRNGLTWVGEANFVSVQLDRAPGQPHKYRSRSSSAWTCQRRSPISAITSPDAPRSRRHSSTFVPWKLLLMPRNSGIGEVDAEDFARPSPLRASLVPDGLRQCSETNALPADPEMAREQREHGDRPPSLST